MLKKIALAVVVVGGMAASALATDRVERVRVVDRHGNVQIVERVEVRRVRRPVRRVVRVRDRRGNIVEKVIIDDGRRQRIVSQRIVRRPSLQIRF